MSGFFVIHSYSIVFYFEHATLFIYETLHEYQKCSVCYCYHCNGYKCNCKTCWQRNLRSIVYSSKPYQLHYRHCNHSTCNRSLSYVSTTSKYWNYSWKLFSWRNYFYDDFCWTQSLSCNGNVYHSPCCTQS